MSTSTQTEAKPGPEVTSPVRSVNPVTNVRETAEGYVIEAEMPGVARDGVSVEVENHELVIVGRKASSNPPGEAVYRESKSFDYKRVFDLDPGIETTRIVARVEQGVLFVTLPKAEVLKPRKISVTD
ncbi:MAG: Hsp20/alpha crystallin family protein [Chthoniobacteraceae bacterium]